MTRAAVLDGSAKVRDACHSLHMPSHIFDRAGQWRDAAAANGASVAAADAFARLPGALGDRGGPINASRGFGFAFNAGNLYHSLEYEAYELLQQCRLDDARDRLTRMGYAAGQALRLLPEGVPDSAAAPDAFAGDVGGAWYNATAYLQWQMRMRARQALWPLLTEMMGDAAPPPARRALRKIEELVEAPVRDWGDGAGVRRAHRRHRVQPRGERRKMMAGIT